MTLSRIGHVGVIVAVLYIIIVILMSLLSPATSAFAQESDPTPAVTSDAPSNGTPPNMTSADIHNLVKLALQGTIALWVILFGFTLVVKLGWYITTGFLAARGISVEPSTTEGDAFPSRAAAVGAKVAKPWKVTGPDSLTVGGKPGNYSASYEDNGALLTSQSEIPTWTVRPPEAAAVNPTQGSSVRVTPSMVGTFTLMATGPNAEEAIISVAAVVAQPVKVNLPVFGQGYGSIAVAIVLLVVVLILGLGSVLTSDAVATLVGGLLGYVFGRATAEVPPSPPGGQTPVV
jgi:hypothetical protein